MKIGFIAKLIWRLGKIRPDQVQNCFLRLLWLDLAETH